MCKVLTLCVLSAALFSLPVQALPLVDPGLWDEGALNNRPQADSMNRKMRASSLRGIKRIQLSANVIHTGVGEDGATESELLTLAKNKLKDAGIEVVTGEAEAPTLRVSGSYITHEKSASGCTVVTLFQPVQTLRSPSNSFSVVTWRRTRDVAGLTKDDVMNKFMDSMDVFITDWLSINK